MGWAMTIFDGWRVGALVACTWVMGIFAFSSAAQAGELVATQITADNAAQFVRSGPDAAGGIGDWALSNGSVCAIVSDISHESELSVRGGVLIDLGYCGRADDHYVGAQDLIDSSRETPVNIDRIDAKVGPTAAVIRTFGGQGGVVVETSYRVDADAPNTLFIQKRLTQIEDLPSVGLYASVFFNFYSLTPFVASTREPSRSNGFVQENFVSRGPTEIATFARTADLIIALSPTDAEAPIAYGWHMRSVTRWSPGEAPVALPFYALADFSALSFLALSEPFLFSDGRDIGLTELLEVPFTDLAPGDEIIFDEALMLSPRAEVSGITDQIYGDAALVSGQVSEAFAVVHVDLADGTPFTQAQADDQGRFSFRLPEGDYALRVVAAGGRQVRSTFSVANANVELDPIDLDTPSRVLLPQGAPMRLVFKGVEGTPDPEFGDSLLGAVERHDNGVNAIHGINQLYLTGTDNDPPYAVLRAGRYRVYATRGPEFSLEQAELTVEVGNDGLLTIAAPVRVVDSPDFISVDFHVHSGASFDTVMPPANRVATFVAEGAEVLVATEHETIFNFHNVIDRLGLGDKIATITGSEITSEVQTNRTPYTLGHANAFPLDVQPLAFRRGAFANENRRWREVIDDLHTHDEGAVIQLNHARSDDRFAPGSDAWDEDWTGNRGSFFDHLGVGQSFNAGLRITEGTNARLVEVDSVTGTRDIDFDAMEVLNGPAKDAETALRRDWLALVAQGFRLTATANSDSHSAWEQVGMPRNMVAVADDTISGFDEAEIVAAVREGRLYGTTGPLLDLSLSASERPAGMGETITGDRATLRVSATSAPWVDVSSLTVVVNGEDVMTTPITRGELFETDLMFEKDSFVVVEVRGEPGVEYAVVYPKLRPYAFSNPVYVDADGDGVWTAPGLGG